MADFELISSRQNPKIVAAASLHDAKNVRQTGLYCFEGKKLFSEALRRQAPLDTVFFREDAPKDGALLAQIPQTTKVYTVTSSVYDKISAEKSPEGIFCIAKTLDKYHKIATIYYKQAFPSGSAHTLLFAVSVRDPGNLGSIIRSAAAFGCGGLILSGDCASIYSSRTVRASMGAMFDFPVLTVENNAESVRELQKSGYTVYASALRRNAVTPDRIPASQKCCMLVGNEGHGLPEELIDLCDAPLYIPMTDKVESLNASVASAVLLYNRFR